MKVRKHCSWNRIDLSYLKESFLLPKRIFPLNILKPFFRKQLLYKVQDKMPLSIDDSFERSKFIQYISLLQWQARVENQYAIPQCVKDIVNAYFRFIDELIHKPRTEANLQRLQEEQDKLTHLLVEVSVQAGASVRVVEHAREI